MNHESGHQMDLPGLKNLSIFRLNICNKLENKSKTYVYMYKLLPWSVQHIVLYMASDLP